MARFRLTGPHCFMTTRGPAQYNAGNEVNDYSIVDFRCTALMIALDAGAEAMLKAECDRLRAEAVSTNSGVAIGIGPISTLPA
jgi:hypothetical protein